jgi:hypothetical protein
MKTLLPWSWGVTLFAAGLAVTGLWLRASAARPEPPPVPAAGPDSERERQRFERQKREMAHVRRRRGERAWILAGAAAGRLSLLGAAARLWAVERHAVDPAHYREMLRQCFPGRSEVERLCRKVIHDVRAEEGALYPTGPAAARLEREFAAHRERYDSAPLLPEVRHE